MTARGRPRAFDRAVALRRAMHVFWERGYEGTSISDLTDAMDINAPSLYAAFGCKEALFREAIALYDVTEGAVTNRALRDEPTARAAVEAMLRRNAAQYVDPTKPSGCMIVLAATIGPPGNSGVRDYLAEKRQQSLDALRARLDRGVADGDLPPGTDTRALAAFYTTVLQGLSIQARDGASRRSLTAIVDGAMRAWESLLPRASRRKSRRK